MKKQVSFGFLTTQMVRMHKAILSEKLNKLGITYGQIGFIMQSVRHPGRTQEDLSIILGIDKGGVARTIVKLEKIGFIYREENPENRRQKLVFPTEKSKDIFESLHTELTNSNEAMLSPLDSDERLLMIKLMTKVIDSSRERLGMPDVWQYFNNS